MRPSPNVNPMLLPKVQVTLDYDKIFVDVPVMFREELIKYYEDIKLLAERKSKVQFKNLGENHAAAVMSLLFSKSESSIKIFAGDFRGNVSGKAIYKSALKEKLETNDEITLSVIFENPPYKNSEGYELLLDLKKKYDARVSIKLADKNQLKAYINHIPHKMVHFTIGDDSMYRFETDVENFKAYCDFNDEGFANKLDELFTILSTDATEIN